MFQAAVQDRLNEQEGVPSVFNPPPSRPLQVNTADHRVYSYIVSRPQPRVGLQGFTVFLLHKTTYSTPDTLLCTNIVKSFAKSHSTGDTAGLSQSILFLGNIVSGCFDMMNSVCTLP